MCHIYFRNFYIKVHFTTSLFLSHPFFIQILSYVFFIYKIACRSYQPDPTVMDKKFNDDMTASYQIVHPSFARWQHLLDGIFGQC